MTEEIRLKLLEWAREYHCAAFIQGDPVQFPHRYMRKQDIEISGLLTALMSFGNRKQILKKADELHGLMGASPHQYVLSCRWKEDFLPADRSSFYRMLSHADFYTYLPVCMTPILGLIVWKMPFRAIRASRWRSCVLFWKSPPRVRKRS